MNFLKITIALVLVIIGQQSLLAQEWVSYQSQNQINDLEEVGNDLLLATDAGLVVLNKTTLEKTIFDNTNSIITNKHVQSITKDQLGTSWIGTYDVMMMRFNGSGFEDPVFVDHPNFDQGNTQLYDFKIAPNGDFWVGTNDGLFQREGQTWNYYGAAEIGESLFDPWDIEINDAGEVFIGSFYIHKFADGIWSNLTDTTDVFNYFINDMFLSSSGEIFIPNDRNNVSRFDGQQWLNYTVNLSNTVATAFTEDTDGNVYFNSEKGGVFKFDTDTFIQEIDIQLEADNDASYFYIDEQNNRWYNYRTFLSVNNNGSIQSTIISEHTIETDEVYSISIGENGKQYFITAAEDNFSVVDADGNWSFLAKPELTESFEKVQDLLVLADDDIYVGSNIGMYQYDGTSWEFLDIGASDDFIMDSQGVIYAQGYNGINIIDNGTLSQYNSANSPFSGIVIGHGLDANDNLWISNSILLEDDNMYSVTPDGVWTNYSLGDLKPRGEFFFDNDGNLWAVDGISGVVKYDGVNFTREFEGLNISSIEGDDSGKIYFGYEFGVLTLLDGQLEDLIINEVPNEFSAAKSDIEIDEQGVLWWASDRYGVFAYTQERITSVDNNFELNVNFTVYPNPVIDFATIEFTNEETGKAVMSIYNQVGQFVSTVDLGEVPPGTNQLRLNVQNIASGIYMAQLQINNQFSSKKIIVH